MAAAFRALPDLDITEKDLDVPLPLGPSDVQHGVLANGLTYYVRAVKKPQKRACIALAVRVGSVVEEDEEQGVAHIVEHLAFNATEDYDNHAIVKFLESIGAEFGACQNAYTSADETVYELMVPTDDVNLLDKAFSVLGQFATKIRCAPGDLQKERGAVLEEWRMARDSGGRAAEAHWKLLLKGCKYEQRQPIGLERIIRNVPADTVRGFYERWYRPHNMAVVVAGDFDATAVVDMLTEHLEGCKPRSPLPAPEVPRFQLAPHSEPRYSAFVDAEASQASLLLSFKHATPRVTTPREFQAFIAETLFHIVLNNRFFKLSRRPSPPYYSATAGPENLTATITASVVMTTAADHQMLEALEAVLVELARIRLHGISEREAATGRAMLMAEFESSYLERNQSYSQDVRDEYVRHFLHSELVIGPELESRLSKTLLPRIKPAELQEQAQRYCTGGNCVVKTVTHQRSVTEEDLKAIVDKVNAMEAAGSIEPWEHANVPEAVMSELPQPGEIAERRELTEIGATELRLLNGMTVCFKSTDFLDDQVLLSGSAAGGLTEVPRSEFRTCSMATTIAGELGAFGLRPEILMDVLSGKRAEVQVSEGAFWRSFSGEQSPVDLEVALQLVHRLFVTSIQPVREELETCMRYTRDAIISQLRNPMQAFSQRVRFINYGSCYYFEPWRPEEVDAINPEVACRHFDAAFRNPAGFKLVLTGKIDEEELLRLVKLYLASIPPSADPPVLRPLDVTPLPIKFPEGVVVETVKVPMIMPRTQAQITFPVQLLESAERPPLAQQPYWVLFACQLLERRLLQVMRFRYGDVYTVSVSPFFAAEAPSVRDIVRGDVGISFSCDPESAARLIKMALDELTSLQETGPSEEEVQTIVNLEQRAFETQQEENGFWHELLMSSYKSRTYAAGGELEEVVLKRMAARKAVIAACSAESMHTALRQLFPFPCRSRYTAVSLLPQLPLLQRLLLALPPPRTALLYSLSAAALGFAAFAALRRFRR